MPGADEELEVATGTATSSEGLERLLEHLKRSRAFDFTGYKRATLTRRIDRRMEQVGIDSYDAYVDHLQVRPGEFTELFNTILINVTDFFRDPPAWDHLRQEVLVPMVAAKGEEAIRVWCAGCAAGQEAYTIAMVLADLLGMDAYRKRVKIYATDVDEDALDHARSGTYTAAEVESVPAPLLERCFTPVPGGYQIDPELRRNVIFGRHDLIQDAPISRVDVLICRNTLMYFNSEVQGRIVARLHFALADGGVLFLGRVEMLLGHADLLTPVDPAQRIFTKASAGSLRGLLGMAHRSAGPEPAGDGAPSSLLNAAFECATEAQVVVDHTGVLVAANRSARATFDIDASSAGRPFADLALSYRPAELRSAIEVATASRMPVQLEEVERRNRRGEVVGTLDVNVLPLDAPGTRPPGVLITFTDVTRFRSLRHDLEHAHQELETAYEELQSSNEELETTNEELQSTVEELETTNEELQSTNEELSSINMELHSINDELRLRTEELNEVNAFMESILASMRGGVVVVDRELKVQVWNARAEDLWGLRPDEAEHRHLLSLDIGLPVEVLRPALAVFLAEQRQPHSIEVDATNRKGRAIRCRVSTSALLGSSGEVEGMILLMEEVADPDGPPPAS